MGGNSSTCRGGSVSNAANPKAGKLPSNAESLAARGAWDEALSTIKEGILPNIALTGSHLGPTAILELCRALEGNDSVKQLELDGNQMGDEGAVHLGDALSRNTTIRSLDVSSNGIGNIGACALAVGLQSNASLTHLELSKNSIMGPGVEKLGVMLGQNASIRQVALSENRVGTQGGLALGSALRLNKTVVILGLRSAALGPEGSSAIAQALAEEVTVMKELSLGKNRILDQGAKEFGEMLKVNKVLKEIYIDENHFGDAGAAVIAEAVEVNHTLQTLWMVQNNLSNETVALFAQSLNQNRALRRLGISSKTQLNPQVRQAMNEARKKRKEQERAKDSGQPLPEIPGDKSRALKLAEAASPASGQKPESAPAKKSDGDNDSDDEDDDTCEVPDDGDTVGVNALPRTARAGKQGVSRSMMDEIRMLDDELEVLALPREETNVSVIGPSQMPRPDQMLFD